MTEYFAGVRARHGAYVLPRQAHRAGVRRGASSHAQPVALRARDHVGGVPGLPGGDHQSHRVAHSDGIADGISNRQGAVGGARGGKIATSTSSKFLLLQLQPLHI